MLELVGLRRGGTLLLALLGGDLARSSRLLRSEVMEM